MDIINLIQKSLQILIQFIFSDNFIILLSIIIIIYHFFQYLIRDTSYIKFYNPYNDVIKVKLEDLKDKPLVNIIVPAWKEGEFFKFCISKIEKLNYPYLKVIINAGGSEETINIANSYKKYDNFIILYQKAGEGKLKAINDCLKHISEGIIYIIDADIILSDSIFLQMLYILINQNEDVVVSSIRPEKSIKNKDLVKYIYINRNRFFDHKLSRYRNSLTPHSAMKYELVNSIGEFAEARLIDDGISMGMDILDKNFKIFYLIEQKAECLTYPLKLIEYFNQNLRWLENYLHNPLINKKLRFLKFFFLTLCSLYFYLLPLVFFFNIYLFFFGILLLFSIYIKKIRKIIFFKKTNRNEPLKFKTFFFIKLIFYIFMDILMNIIVFFEFVFYQKAFKKRKNLI